MVMIMLGAEISNGINKVFLIVIVSLITLLVIAYTSTAVASDDDDNYYFYMYGSPYCPHCKALVEFLNKTYGPEHIYFCDVSNNDTCRLLFTEFVEIGMTEGVPTTFVVYDNTVSAVVVGEYRSKEFFDKLLRVNTDNKIPVYGAGAAGVRVYGYLVIEGSHEDFIAKYLCMKPYCKNPINATITIRFEPYREVSYSIIEVLPALLVLGLLDSINPCTLTLYFSFVASCLAGKKSIGPPILFIIVIYAGYLLLGYALLLISSIIPPQVFIGLALVMGIYTVIKAGRSKMPSFKCEWCEKLGIINRVMSSKYLLALVLSLFSVFVLLPCTAGPLAAFVGILHGYPWYIRLPSLLLYNIVFIIPLLLIFIGTYYLGKERRIAEWLKNNSDAVEFLVGFLLILIALVLLLSTL